MDKNAILLIGCLFDEVKYLYCNLIIVIKQKLPIVVKPVESQVFDTNLGPLVLQLPSSTIDNMRNLVDG